MALGYGASRVIVAEGSFYGNVFEYEKNGYMSAAAFMGIDTEYLLNIKGAAELGPGMEVSRGIK